MNTEGERESRGRNALDSGGGTIVLEEMLKKIILHMTKKMKWQKETKTMKVTY